MMILMPIQLCSIPTLPLVTKETLGRPTMPTRISYSAHNVFNVVHVYGHILPGTLIHCVIGIKLDMRNTKMLILLTVIVEYVIIASILQYSHKCQTNPCFLVSTQSCKEINCKL